MPALTFREVLHARVAIECAVESQRPEVRRVHLSDDAVLATALLVLRHYESLMHSAAYREAAHELDCVAGRELAVIARRPLEGEAA